MAELNELGCKIYVETTAPLDELLHLLSPALAPEHVSKVAGVRTVHGPQGDLELRKNEEADRSRAGRFPDGFLHFAYALELYFSPLTRHQERIDLTANLLNLLWSKGLPAVAACDYENDLPHGGGYKNHTVPWPATRDVSTESIRIAKQG
jgi:hypothetical protein